MESAKPARAGYTAVSVVYLTRPQAASGVGKNRYADILQQNLKSNTRNNNAQDPWRMDMVHDCPINSKVLPCRCCSNVYPLDPVVSIDLQATGGRTGRNVTLERSPTVGRSQWCWIRFSNKAHSLNARNDSRSHWPLHSAEDSLPRGGSAANAG